MNTFSYHLVPAGLMVDEALCNMGAAVVPTGVGNTGLAGKDHDGPARQRLRGHAPASS